MKGRGKGDGKRNEFWGSREGREDRKRSGRPEWREKQRFKKREFVIFCFAEEGGKDRRNREARKSSVFVFFCLLLCFYGVYFHLWRFSLGEAQVIILYFLFKG